MHFHFFATKLSPGFLRHPRVASTLGILLLIGLTANAMGCERPTALALATIRTLQDKGENEAALQHLQAFLHDTPDHPEANFRLGTLLIQQGHRERAIWPLERAFQDPTYRESAGLLLLSIFLDANDEKQAIRIADVLLTQAPDLSSARLLRGTAYLQIGRNEDALHDAQTLLKREPENIRAMLLENYALGRLGRSGGALEAAVRKAPENIAMQVIYAMALAQRGDFDASLSALASTLRTHPRNAELLSAKADILNVQGRYREAASAIASIPKTEENRESLLIRQANLLLSAGARKEAQTIIARIDDPAAVALLNGRIALLDRDFENALQLLSRALTKWPQDPQAHYDAGLAALNLGQFQRAAFELREATRLDQIGATDAPLLLAQLQMQRGYFERAEELARLFLSRFAGGKPKTATAEAYRILVLAQLNQSRISEAETDYRKLHELDRSSLSTAVIGAALARGRGGPQASIQALRSSGLDLTKTGNEPALYALIDDLIELGDFGKARKAVDNALAVHPNRPSLYTTLGRIDWIAGKRSLAKASYEHALALDHEFSAALFGLGLLARDRGETDKALDLLNRAQAHTSNADPYVIAADILVKQRHRDAAVAQLRKAIELFPTHTGALNNLAWELAEGGTDLDEALELARRSVRLSPDANALDTLGWVHFRRAEFQQAQAAFESSLQKRDDPIVHYHLGLVLQERGDTSAARQQFELALSAKSAFPGADDVRSALDRLPAEQP